MNLTNHDHKHDHEHTHDDGLVCGEDGCAIPSYSAEEVLVRDDIMKKAQELAQLISTSDEVRIFREAERKVTTHDDVQAIIKQIKKKQKEIVGFEVFKNDKMVAKIEGEIAELEAQLDRYPIVEEFRQTQEDINYLLQLIVGVIRDKVSEQIAVEAGTVTEQPTYSD